MNTLLLTLALAFIIVVIAIGLMAIGWLLTGRSHLQAGACGRDPTKKRDEKGCGTSADCGLCEKNEKPKQE